MLLLAWIARLEVVLRFPNAEQPTVSLPGDDRMATHNRASHRFSAAFWLTAGGLFGLGCS